MLVDVGLAEIRDAEAGIDHRAPCVPEHALLIEFRVVEWFDDFVVRLDNLAPMQIRVDMMNHMIAVVESKEIDNGADKITRGVIIFLIKRWRNLATVML